MENSSERGCFLFVLSAQSGAAQGSEVVLSCRFSRKNSAVYATEPVGYAGSIPQQGKRKTQVMKPGVFVIVDRFYRRIHLRRT